MRSETEIETETGTKTEDRGNQRHGPTESRAAILGNVRKALGVPAHNDAARAEAVRQRLAQRPRVPPPQRIAGEGRDLEAVFREELARQLVDIADAATPAEIPDLIASYLNRHGQPLTLRHGNDPLLSGLDFAGAGLVARLGAAERDDTAGLSSAYAAIAETGTLALLSGEKNPVTLGFLPETHIVIVRLSTLVAACEDAFARLRESFGDGTMPRTLNLISGPSRTADIGGRIVIGAHGPRRLFAILLARD